MKKIIRVDLDDIESVALLYEFKQIDDPDWEKMYKMFIELGIYKKIPESDSLTGMNFLCATLRENKANEEYLLVDEFDPVTRFEVKYHVNDHIVEIAYYTRNDCQQKGYASLGLSLLTEELFQDQNIGKARLVILGNPNSAKVATNAGYTFTGFQEYEKMNPNFKKGGSLNARNSRS